MIKINNKFQIKYNFFCNKTYNNIKNGYTLVELMISFIIISCLIAGATPIITKKIKNNMTQGKANNYFTDCPRFSDTTNKTRICNLCTLRKCLNCEIPNCTTTINVDTCTCN